MKHENFEAAKKLVEQIDDLNRTLSRLDTNSCLEIEISVGNYRIMTIESQKDSKGEYSDFGRQFIHEIQSDIARRIDNMKGELELL